MAYTKEQLVNFLDQYLFGWEYKDIEKASIYVGAKMAGFILGACFIDAMAGFYAGVNRKESEKNSSQRFKNFVGEYLKQYDKEELWKDLRCDLVHSYAAGESYVFTDGNKGGFHFEKTKKGETILNLEDFLADLREAYKRFRDDILVDQEIFKKAERRYNLMGLMMTKPREEL